MLFKPLRGDSLFRASTSQSQFTKYIFGSEIDSHKLHFSITKTLPAPSSSTEPLTFGNVVLSFSETAPWGPELDGYSINQANSSCEAHRAKCSPWVQSRRGTLVPDERKIRGEGQREEGEAGLFSNLVIWSQRQANLFFFFLQSVL